VEALYRWFIETSAAQADDIERGKPGAVANNVAERNYVPLDTGNPTDHCCSADPYELMNCRRTADYRVVANSDMTAHYRVVRNDHVVSHRAIMRHMYYRHQHTIVADAGDADTGCGTAMDRTMLAHQGPGADLTPCGLVSVFHVLRREADGAERKELGIFADACVTLHHDMRYQLRTGFDHDVGPHRAKRPDFHPAAKFSAMRHDRTWVYAGSIRRVQPDIHHRIHEYSVRGNNFAAGSR
jgi:hypothetical protein